VNSDFCRDVNKICPLLGFYAAYGNTILLYVKSQKRADLINGVLFIVAPSTAFLRIEILHQPGNPTRAAVLRTGIKMQFSSL
jgi:hypothetical protein